MTSLFSRMEYKVEACSESSNSIDEILTSHDHVYDNAEDESAEERGKSMPSNEDDFLPAREQISEFGEEEEVESEEEDQANIDRITPELIRRCVSNYDFFNTLNFDLKFQLIEDLSDAIAMSNAPKQYYTDTAFRILLDRLDIEEEPYTNWVGAMLIMFYTRKRIGVDDIYFETLYEKIQEWSFASPFIQSLIQVIEQTLDLNK